MKQSPKPTIEEIIAKRERLRELYSGIRSLWEKEEQFYEGDFKDLLYLPEERKNSAIILPTHRDMVDTFVDHIDISNARIYTDKQTGGGKLNQDEERFYYGAIYANTVGTPIAPQRVSAKHFSLHGLSLVKTMWYADMWPSKPIQKPDESDTDYKDRFEEWEGETQPVFPIKIEAVHPHNGMFDPSQGPPSYVVELHEDAVYDIKKRYPHWSNPKASDLKANCEITIYWDENYRCTLVDDEPVLKIQGGVVKHNYGFLPYVPIESGLGNVSYDGALEKRFVGMLRYIFDVLIAESRAYSLNDIVLQTAAMPWGVLFGENADRVQTIEQAFGSYTKLPPGVDIKQMTPMVPPAALVQHLGLTSNAITSHAAPPSTRGVSEEGVRSAADRRLMISQAAMRYSYSKDAFKYGWSQVLMNAAKIYKHCVPGNVRVWAKRRNDYRGQSMIIDKKNMREPFSCFIEFNPISPEDDYRQHDDLERRFKAGLVSQQFAWEQQNDVDPDEMAVQVEMEMLKRDPNLQQLVSSYAAGKLMQALSKRQMAEGGPPPQLGMAPPGMPGQPGMVPGQPGQIPGRMTGTAPNVAAPGSPQDMQNKLKGMRSPNPMNPGQGQGGGGASGRTY